ncbi:MAG: hypothetical protein HRT87_06640 [Legionellales bacterium]|nr:hypothetical protein [Legionellales bacterium]
MKKYTVVTNTGGGGWKNQDAVKLRNRLENKSHKYCSELPSLREKRDKLQERLLKLERDISYKEVEAQASLERAIWINNGLPQEMQIDFMRKFKERGVGI